VIPPAQDLDYNTTDVALKMALCIVFEIRTYGGERVYSRVRFRRELN
jgi:hypothetical protein